MKMIRLFSAFLFLMLFMAQGIGLAGTTNLDTLVLGGDLTVLGTTTTTGGAIRDEQGMSKSITFIDEVTDTPNTVTAAKTGYTYLFDAVSAGTYVLTLPATPSTGIYYRFISATTTTLNIRPSATSGDRINYLSLDANDAIASPATSSSLTLVGKDNVWYIAEMTGTFTDGGTK